MVPPLNELLKLCKNLVNASDTKFFLKRIQIISQYEYGYF